MTVEDHPWWRDAVIYQIYPRSFADSNGDGVGDLGGIIDHIDYLYDLGVDALWLSPIFRSPMKDFGYDVADYCDVDPVFGDLADVDRLVRELHDRGMRLLLDWVPNHSSCRHPWFVDSRSSRDSVRRNWYVWRDPLPDGSPPTNWRSRFKDVSAWTFDQRTGQSYLHTFLAEQPDLNWAEPAVESAMHDTLRFWLDRGVDGFRADVVHLIGKGDDVDDLPPEEAARVVPAIDRPFGHHLLRRVRELMDGYAHHPMMVGEVNLLRPGQAAGYLGEPEAGRGELHLSFDFRPLLTAWEPGAMRETIGRSQSEFAEPRWPTWVLSNHDKPRHRTRYGSDARARAAAVVSLTMRGTPFLYAGEELGLEDAIVPDDQIVDPDGRDGCRAPIPWTSDGDDVSGRGWGSSPWLPFAPNAGTNSADLQVGSPGSMHTLYRELLGLRRSSETLRRGTMVLDGDGGPVLRYTRSAGDDVIAVAVNMGDDGCAWPDDLDGELIISSDPRREARGEALFADEAVVVRMRSAR
jgi:alpha-glucosidase